MPLGGGANSEVAKPHPQRPLGAISHATSIASLLSLLAKMRMLIDGTSCALNSAFVARYDLPLVYIFIQVHGGSVMRSRFEYEAPGLLKKTLLTITAPHRWRSCVRPWVFDKQGGVRFQLAKDELVALQPLTSRLRNGSTPPQVSIAFDQAADAILNRRRGYCFEWNRLAKQTAAEWNDHLGERDGRGG